MKVIGVSFSARKEGNCSTCLQYILNKLSKDNFETKFMEINDNVINSCRNCNYECFKKDAKCPIEDDYTTFFNEVINSDLLIFGIPTYGGHTSGLFRSFIERRQSLDAKRQIQFENITKSLVVIANFNAGGDMAVHEALFDLTNPSSSVETLVLSSREYFLKSIDGNLLDSLDVRKRLDNFVKRQKLILSFIQ